MLGFPSLLLDRYHSTGFIMQSYIAHVLPQYYPPLLPTHCVVIKCLNRLPLQQPPIYTYCMCVRMYVHMSPSHCSPVMFTSTQSYVLDICAYTYVQYAYMHVCLYVCVLICMCAYAYGALICMVRLYVWCIYMYVCLYV